MHEKTIEIRWRDLDAFRHVNNATFLTYLEECRDEFVTRVLGAGGGLDDYVLVHLEIDYRRALTQDDDHVVVRCGLDRVGRSSVHLKEEIRTREGELAANAASVLVPVDHTTGGARRLSDDERAAFERER